MPKFLASALALALLVGCGGVAERNAEPVYVGAIVAELGAGSEGVLGEFARADAAGRRRLAETNGVATALYVIQDMDAYPASQSLTEIAEAFLLKGRREDARLALEMGLAAILAYDTGGDCPAGPFGVMCRLRKPVGPGFNRRWGISRVAVVAAKNGFDEIVEEVLAATDEPEVLREKVASVREGLARQEDQPQPRPPPDPGMERPEDLSDRLRMAGRLAEAGHVEVALAWARESLPEVRAQEAPDDRGRALVRVAEALLAAGEREEAMALAEEAWEETKALNGEGVVPEEYSSIPEREWYLKLSVALFLKEAGDEEGADRAALSARESAQEIKLDRQDSMSFSLYAQFQRQRAYSMWTNGWYSHALMLSRWANDQMYAPMGFAGTALAVWADDDLAASEKTAIYNQVLNIVDPLPIEPDPQWRAGAEKDPLLAAMYVASAVAHASRRRGVYQGILNQAIGDGRDDLIPEILEELAALEPVLGSPFDGFGSLEEEFLLLGGEHRERALAHLEEEVKEVHRVEDPMEQMAAVLELARLFQAGDQKGRFKEMVSWVRVLAWEAESEAKDDLLHRATVGLVGLGVREEMKEMIWKIKDQDLAEWAYVALVSVPASEGDEAAAWMLNQRLEGLDQRLSLLISMAERANSTGNPAALERAMEALGAFLQESDNIDKLSFFNHISLGDLYLAKGSREEAVTHYELAAALAPALDEGSASWGLFSLAGLAKNLGMPEETGDLVDQAWAAAPGYMSGAMVTLLLWGDFYSEALDGALRPREGRDAREKMLVDLVTIAKALNSTDDLDQEEIEGMLAEILAAVG